MREPHKLPHETIHRSLSEANLRTERKLTHGRPVSNIVDASSNRETTAGAVHAAIWQRKIDMVEDVKELELQLGLRSLGDTEVFEQREVGVEQLGPPKVIPPDVAEGVWLRLPPWTSRLPRRCEAYPACVLEPITTDSRISRPGAILDRTHFVGAARPCIAGWPAGRNPFDSSASP